MCAPIGISKGMIGVQPGALEPTWKRALQTSKFWIYSFNSQTSQAAVTPMPRKIKPAPPEPSKRMPYAFPAIPLPSCNPVLTCNGPFHTLHFHSTIILSKRIPHRVSIKRMNIFALDIPNISPITNSFKENDCYISIRNPRFRGEARQISIRPKKGPKGSMGGAAGCALETI